jgi:SAM-dependent methyltransferase
MMSQEEFVETGVALSREAKVLDGLHGYFTQHYSRVYECCQGFKLLESNLGDVLEIGPFYSYTPFVLRRQASSYTVLEGDDPAAYPLEPLYAQRQIALQFVDLFEMFGPTHTASHTLPFADTSFDSVLCWGTMEHFNFNPVRFVRELRRVLKPGGKAYINVPNKASFQNLASLLFGRYEREHVDCYFQFENYSCNGKQAFYGFHWREYTGPELARLFSRAGFAIQSCDLLVTFQDNTKLSPARKLLRHGTRLLAGVLPRYGTDVCLVAERRD